MPMHDGDKVQPRKNEVLVQRDGITASVQKSSVSAYERLGWTLVDDRSSESAIGEPSPKAETKGKSVKDSLEDKEQ